MQCENRFYVYWFQDAYALNQISLDNLGCCDACILADLEKAVMQKARKKTLNRLEKAEKAFDSTEIS